VSRGWIAMAIIGGGSAVADVVVFALWPYDLPAVEVVLHVATGVAWVGAGLVAWARHPELRIGALMAAVGIAWFWQEPWWTTALRGTVGYLLANLALAVGLHAILAFPSGRLQTRLERILVAAGYATVLLGDLAETLFYDPALDCSGVCPRNLLLIRHEPSIADAISTAQGVMGIVIGVMAMGICVRRWRRATAAGRAVLGPVMCAAAFDLVAIVVRLSVDTVGTAPQWLFWVAWIGFAVIPSRSSSACWAPDCGAAR